MHIFDNLIQSLRNFRIERIYSFQLSSIDKKNIIFKVNAKKCGNLQKLEKGNWKSFVHENEMSCESLKKLKLKI